MEHEPYYTLTTAGTASITLAEVKAHLKRPVTFTADDVLLQSLIDAATQYGQKYTAREFTANTWTLLIDCLTDRVRLNRNPIDSITSIEHLVDDILITIPSTDYYKKDLTQWVEVLLISGKSWPTNTDDREHAIKIIFVTKQYPCGNLIKEAMLLHIAYWYSNKGDCDAGDAAKLSGANDLYNQIRIPRI